MTRGIVIKASMVMAGLSMAGCVTTSTPQQAADLFDCAALDRAVASAANGFEDIKGRYNDTRLTRSWETDVQAFHDACVITSAQRPDHYVCFGRLQIDDPSSTMAAGSEALGQCLGSEWTSTATGDDEWVLFSRAGTDAVVSLETFFNDRGHRIGALSVYQKVADAMPLADEEINAQ